MKNTKKVLSVALAGALAFGSMGATFAAMPVMDVKTDNNIAKAVERLNSFGIINGMEDGKYHEEMKVTREQFAKLLVEALGLGNAANAAKGATKFADIESSRWSTGYVNVAVGQGLLKGYPDGTFKPAAEVSYAEAVTMLVRALGYKDEFLRGSWPGNYVAKAAETGITNGAKFNDAAGTADRGTVALLVDNTLNSKVIKIKEFNGSNIIFEETNKILLKDKLGLNKYENVRIVADTLVNNSLSNNRVTIKFLRDMDSDQKINVKNEYKANDIKDFDLASNVNVKNVIGEEATVYLNDKNEVVYAASENDDKAIFDYVKGTTTNNELSLVKFDHDYKLAKNADVYVFDGKEKYTKASVDKDGNVQVTLKDLVGKVGKFVVKNNEVVYAEILNTTEGTPFVVVKGNNSGKITGINQMDEKFSIDLSKDGNYKGVVAFDQNGNSIDVKDIKEGNLLYIQKQKVDTKDYAVLRVVTNNIVTGKLGKIKDDKVEIEGKEYTIENYTKDGTTSYDAYYSVDKDQNSKQWKSNNWSNDMRDADNAQVTAYLDASGRVAYLTTEAKASSGYKYGVITKIYADKDRVKVYNVNAEGKGEEIIYYVEESKNLDNAGTLNEYGQKVDIKGAGVIYEGSVVKFKLNKAGQIAKDEIYMMDKSKYHVMNDNKDFGKDTIPSKLNGLGTVQSFTVDSNTQLIGAKNLTTGATSDSMKTVTVKDDFGIAKWSDMASDRYNSNLKYYVFSDDTTKIDAKAVIFVGTEGSSTSEDSQAIYVIDTWLKGGDTYIEYMDSDAKINERKVTSNGNVVDEKPYIVKVSSDGKIDLNPTDKGNYTKITGTVSSKNGDILIVNNKEYKLSDKTVVYEQDAKKSISNINKGDVISFIVENDVNIRVVERLVKDELTAYTSLRSELESANAELKAMQSELVLAQAELALANNELTAANTELTSANNELTAGQAELAAAQNELTLVQAELDAAKLTGIQNDIETAQAKVDVATAKITTAQGKITTAQGKITVAQGNITTAQGKATTAQGKVTTAQSKVTIAQGKVNTAQNKMNQMNN